MTEPSSRLPNLTKDTEEFINEIESENTTPLYELTPQEARDFLKNLQSKTFKKIDADIEEIDIEGVKTFVVKPLTDTTKKLPAVLYLHGGGWVMGDEYVFENLIREIANCAEAAVIFPEYTPAPEARYPQTKHIRF